MLRDFGLNFLWVLFWVGVIALIIFSCWVASLFGAVVFAIWLVLVAVGFFAFIITAFEYA